MNVRDELAQQALALPSDDRAFLADLLEQSLPHSPQATREIAAEWTAEINRRVEAYARGETRAIDASTAMQEMRRQLAERRAGNAP